MDATLLLIRHAAERDLVEIANIQRHVPQAAQWDASGYELLVAECESAVVGFLAWRAIATDEAEILNLATAPGFRRRGAARALVLAVRVPNVFLEVRESNSAAQALYRKCGFTEAGIRFGYYSNPIESAIVMRRQS